MQTGFSSDAGGPNSLNDIRERHLDLMDQTLDSDATLKLAETIVEFMHKVAAAGADLEAEDERAVAQDLLDYWNATLLTSGARNTIQSAPTKLADFVQGVAPGQTSDKNPFEDISAWGLDKGFFGRKDAIGAVIERLKHPIVFVTGTAGSGRSSLVISGVAPQLESRPSEPLKVLTLSSPGPDPLQTLCDLAGDVRNIRPKDLRRSPRRFREIIDPVCGDRRALVVVDNVEELFTRCNDPSERELFAEAIVSLAAEPHHSVILIVREYKFDALAELPALKPYATPEACYSPRPPTVRDIEGVLVALANKAKLRMDRECVEELARDLRGDPAALALGRFMLLHLWPYSTGGFAGLKAYQKLGRPNEALDRIADETYEALSSDDAKKAAERLFLALCKPDLQHGIVSQRESKRTLNLDGSDAAMNDALHAFDKAGLIRESENEDDADKSIEIVSDRLINQWRRLSEWLEAKKDRRYQVLAAADLWDKSTRSPAYLFTDRASIKDAERFDDGRDETKTLHEFLRASSDALTRALRRRQYFLELLLVAVVGIAVCLLAIIYLVFLVSAKQRELLNARIDNLQRLSLIERPFIKELTDNDKMLRERKIEEITNLKQPFDRQMLRELWYINLLQRFGTADINLSNIEIGNLDLRDSNLKDLRLLNSKLYGVDWRSSHGQTRDLTYLVLNGSAIINSFFVGTNLSLAQFRESTLDRVDFSYSNLYRAAFDDAHFLDTNFFGSSVIYTTFSNAVFDDNTLLSLTGTAWWQAKGLGPQAIDRLLKLQKLDPRNSAAFIERQRKELAELLNSTDPLASSEDSVIGDVKRAYTYLVSASTGDTLTRAAGLGDWAWTLATNLGTSDDERGHALDNGKCDGPAMTPRTAEMAARQALCLIQTGKTKNDGTLSGAGSETNTDSNELNLEDTLGYILLQQRGREAEARDHLKKAASGGSKEARYRYALAEMANGDACGALADLKAAGGYVPSHERRWLTDQIDKLDSAASSSDCPK